MLQGSHILTPQAESPCKKYCRCLLSCAGHCPTPGCLNAWQLQMPGNLTDAMMLAKGPPALSAVQACFDGSSGNPSSHNGSSIASRHMMLPVLQHLSVLQCMFVLFLEQLPMQHRSHQEASDQPWRPPPQDICGTAVLPFIDGVQAMMSLHATRLLQSWAQSNCLQGPYSTNDELRELKA